MEEKHFETKAYELMVTPGEASQINKNFEYAVEKFLLTAPVINKNDAVAQYLIRKQQEKIEKLKKIQYLKDKIEDELEKLRTQEKFDTKEKYYARNYMIRFLMHLMDEDCK